MIDLRDAIAITTASVRTHKLRAFLAASGVVLGIASVIAVVTLGAGIQDAILGSINQQYDPTTVTVTLQSAGSPGGGNPAFRPQVLAFTDRDVDALARLPDLREAGASAPLSGVEVVLGGQSFGGTTVVAHRGPRLAGYLHGQGPRDDTEATVSNLTAQRIADAQGRGSGSARVLGTQLTVRSPDGRGGYAESTVTVVGIEKEGNPFSPPQDQLVVGAKFGPTVPLNGQPVRAWQVVSLRAASASVLGAAKAEVQRYMEQNSDARVLKGDRLEFLYLTADDAAKLVSSSVGQFTTFIGGIGAVSLLVGLVGIANIMLVSVQERTREIGVMKATGATRADVILVFLVESVAICTVGAVLGVALGLVMGIGLTELLRSFNPSSPAVPFVAQPGWYLIAVVLGVAVGLIAGIYPAARAAKVSPVEALRYE